MSQRIAVIIGAGPAGLTAAYELLEKTDIKPIIFEMSGDVGGISKTVRFKGNRIDLGGHRFFSKSDRVTDLWLRILPLQGAPSRDDILLNRKLPLSELESSPDPEKTDKVMIIRNRLSRIFFLGKFFDYPVSVNVNTLVSLGALRITKILVSYVRTKMFPKKPEVSLEDFFVNRFGTELYETFFRDYTEKVWGVPCRSIRADWGAQRIKGLSISKALLNALKKVFVKDSSIAQKNTETSLIERFFYPKYGPGQLWETMASIIFERGGEIALYNKVVGVNIDSVTRRVASIEVEESASGKIRSVSGDYFFSTMAVKDLIEAMGRPIVPQKVRDVSDSLIYRDFITVGLLLKKLKIKNNTKIRTINDLIPDTWIYVQEKEVKVGRLQIYNNWSPYMVADEKNVWIGMEYFCNEGDQYWSMDDASITEFAVKELATIGIIDSCDVIDSTVIRMAKTYPAYFGGYDNFEIIREFVDTIENLFLVGRNGMHKYNNQDHSMLTAITAVENIVNGVRSKANIWEVNTEDEYHEAK